MGQTILKNSSTKLLMKQDSSSIDLITDTFKLSAGERRQLLACEKGDGLLFALGARIAIRVEASPDEHALSTTDPRELEQLQAVRRAERVDGANPLTGVQVTTKRTEELVTRDEESSAEAEWSPPVMGLACPWVPAVPSAFVAMQAGNPPAHDPESEADVQPNDPLMDLPTRFFQRPKPSVEAQSIARSEDAVD